VDKEKIDELKALVLKKLSPFSTVVQRHEGGTCTHLELSMKFRRNDELDAAIACLQQDQ
jgi:hypothetical protein